MFYQPLNGIDIKFVSTLHRLQESAICVKCLPYSWAPVFDKHVPTTSFS